MHDKNFDEELLEWIRNKRAEKQRVSRRLIQQQAMKLLGEKDDEEQNLKLLKIILIKIYFFYLGQYWLAPEIYEAAQPF